MNNTKAGRINSRQIQFQRLIESGYLQETYKEVDFFTKTDGKYFTLKVFWGTGANHILYMNYRTIERRSEQIQNYKDNYDRKQAYKAELKANPKKSSHANCATAIREELKKEFPYIKFSVKSDTFAGGNSVDISWEDGPTNDQVTNFTSKYQYGHFNGMEDIYEYTNNREDLPQAKYVSAHRNMSKDTEEKLLKDGESIFVEDRYNCHNLNNFIYRIFTHCPIPEGATVTGITGTGETCGLSSPETFYKIAYDMPETKKQAIIVPFKPLQIIEYSDKSFAVIGETKPIKDRLKQLGGSFNFRLTCGAGWIFPKAKYYTVKTALAL